MWNARTRCGDLVKSRDGTADRGVRRTASSGRPTRQDPRKGASPVNAVRSFAARRKDAEEGFTLIELMVVVLIIAILIAIAIPQFLGARSRAQDRAAQSSLRNALTAAKTAYTDASSYGQATSAAADLPTIEPSLKYVDG